eukprot:scaffold1307_cov200-Pinguiococcus_pyrenoidosus.AAC.102
MEHSLVQTRNLFSTPKARGVQGGCGQASGRVPGGGADQRGRLHAGDGGDLPDAASGIPKAVVRAGGHGLGCLRQDLPKAQGGVQGCCG